MFVSADGYLLHAVEFGSGPAFVAHGGSVGNWELWQEPFEMTRGATVVAEIERWAATLATK